MGLKEIAEAMAAEGIEADVIKRVLLNLGFSQEEAVRAAARACVSTASSSLSKEDKEGGEVQGQRRGEGRAPIKMEKEGALPNAKELQHRLSILEGRVAALIDLLSDYIPVIVEKVKAKELSDERMRSLM